MDRLMCSSGWPTKSDTIQRCAFVGVGMNMLCVHCDGWAFLAFCLSSEQDLKILVSPWPSMPAGMLPCTPP